MKHIQMKLSHMEIAKFPEMLKEWLGKTAKDFKVWNENWIHIDVDYSGGTIVYPVFDSTLKKKDIRGFHSRSCTLRNQVSELNKAKKSLHEALDKYKGIVGDKSMIVHDDECQKRIEAVKYRMHSNRDKLQKYEASQKISGDLLDRLRKAIV